MGKKLKRDATWCALNVDAAAEYIKKQRTQITQLKKQIHQLGVDLRAANRLSNGLAFSIDMDHPRILRRNAGEALAYDALEYDFYLNGRRIGIVWGSIPNTDADERSNKVNLHNRLYSKEDEDEDDDVTDVAEKSKPKVDGEPWETDITKIQTPETFVVWATLEDISSIESATFMGQAETPQAAALVAETKLTNIIKTLKDLLK